MLDCIVIGAGPCGIVATKELLEQGIDNILCLEQSEKLGGVFSKAYDNLRLTSSATFSMFSDFWIGDNSVNKFWSKEEVLKYWNAYSEHFKVNQYIRYGNKVIKIENIENELGGEKSWKVHLESGKFLTCHRVALATGNNSIPGFPSWKKELTNVVYSHSTTYKNASSYKGKRVLVVGGGESGSDIALEISKVAEKCWISLRNSTGWVVPRKRGDVATDNSTHRGIWNLPLNHGIVLSKRLIKREEDKNDPVFNVVADLNKLVVSTYGVRGVYGTKSLGLAKAIANHNCELVREVISVKDGGVTINTSDGKILEGIDEIVFCTGYVNEIPILPEEFKKCDPRSLYKHMINPALSDRLFWLGWARPGFGSHFPIMEMQARLLALIVSGKHTLPSPVKMEQISSIDRAESLNRFEHNAYRERSLVDYHYFMDDLANVIGCEPPLTKYFFRNPKLWVKLVFGPTQATQFRLKGPGKKIEKAHEILRKLPDVRFNKIIKEGILGRIQYSLKK